MPSSSRVSVTPATASSAAAADPAAPDGAQHVHPTAGSGDASTAGGGADRRWVRSVPLVVVLGAIAVVAVLVRRDGHWWGDDWALYLRQAEAVLGGDVARVVADNRFTVDVSGLPEFTPPMYPWGYPLLLAPFVAVLGTGLDRIVLSQVVFLVWFAAMWYRLARPRLGTPVALLGTVVVGMSPQYLRWVEFVQSEIAYLAVTLTALVVLDRPGTRASLVGRGAAWWPLVTVGLVGGLAFSVRKEALAVVAAVGVAQLVALARLTWGADRGTWSWRADAPPLLGRLLVPHAAFAAVVGLLELVLPSTLVPSYTGNGLHNVWGFASDHLGHVAAQLGMRHVWLPAPTVMGNSALGWLVVAAFVIAFVVGAVTMLVRRPDADAPLLAFGVVALAIGGSFRYAGSRYVAVLGPIALIVAAVGVATIVRLVARAFLDPPDEHLDGADGADGRNAPDDHDDRARTHRGAAAGTGVVTRTDAPARRRVTLVAQVAVLVSMALLASAVVTKAIDQVRDVREFHDAGQVQWGPDHPDSLAMFAAVRDLTRADDVIGFFKARAMTFRTDRRAVQVDRWHPVDRGLEHLTHVVVEHDDPLVPRLAGELGAELRWSNPRFRLYALPTTSPF